MADQQAVTGGARRRRNPEGRRAEILAAAASLIRDRGLERLSYRTVADRAGVPLGSTTYYFPTLADLRDQALEAISRSRHEALAPWRDRLVADPSVDTVVAMITDYLADRSVPAVEYETYGAAARDQSLRPLTAAWVEHLEGPLREAFGEELAPALSYLLDGATLRALMTGQPLDEQTLRPALTALLAGRRTD